MNCPSCSAALPYGQDRCPACGAALGSPVEGALAKDPARVTPPRRDKPEPRREAAVLRKKEPTWKDEVRERVRTRRQKRQDVTGLPLFEEAPAPEPEVIPEPVGAPGVAEAALMAVVPPPPVESPIPPVAATLRLGLDLPLVDPYAATERMEPLDRPRAPESTEPPDLPIRPREAAPKWEAEPDLEPATAEEAFTPAPEWSLEMDESLEEPPPVERPAQPMERAQAACVDLGLLAGLWAVVVYFATRAAHAPLLALLPTWPYLVGYLAFVGFVYAIYFTGTTGQTPGKMLCGLRVVDTAGRPPGYARVFLRAVLGTLGILLLFLGVVPIFADPARRTLHDRLFKTRVVSGG